MKFEYKKYGNRDKMLEKIFLDRFLLFLPAPIIALLGIGVIVYDTDISIGTFYLWSLIIFGLYLLSIFILRVGYSRYSSNFVHTCFAKTNLISALLISSLYFAIPLYGVYTVSKKDDYAMLIVIFIATIYTFVVTKYTFNKMKENFSSFYHEINGKIFFDHYVYRDCNQTPKVHMTICISLLAFTSIQGLTMRSFHYPAGYAITICWVFFSLSFLLYPFLVRAVHALFIHCCVEKRFGQRLLSDNWGFFELDPALAEKFFGPGPRIKRPIQYEEVFPTRNSQ